MSARTGLRIFRSRSALILVSGLGVVAAIVIALSLPVMAALRPRDYTVRLIPEAIPVEHLGQVVRLLQEREAIHRWVPQEASDETLQLMVKHIQSNPQAEDWLKLKRAGQSPKLAALNSALDVLSLHAQSLSPRELSRQGEEGIRLGLKRAFEVYIRERRQECLRRLADSTELEKAVAGAVEPGCPAPAGLWRRWVCGLFDKPIEDRERWGTRVLETLVAHQPQLEALLGRYEAAQRFTESEFAAWGSYRLVARRMHYPQPQARPVVWRSGQAYVDCEVWLRTLGYGEGPHYLRDTGLRFLEMPIAVSPSGEAQVAWPPGEVVIAEETLRTYLLSQGFPEGLELATAQARVEGLGRDLRLRINSRIKAEAFPEWFADRSLPLWEDGPASAQLAETAQQLRQELAQFLPQARRISSAIVRIQPAEGNQFAVQLQDESSPAVRLRMVLDPQLRPCWLGPLTQTDAERITDWLVAHQPEFRGVRALLRVEEVGLSPNGRLVGRLVLPASQAGGSAIRLRWPSEPGDPPRLKWPENYIPPAPPKRPRPSAKAVDVKAIMEEQMALFYPRLSAITEVVPAGDQWVIGLRIGDWPILRLGPVAPQDEAEAQDATLKLLTDESVKAAALEQWGNPEGGITHPLYGQVTARIVNWNPRKAEADVACNSQLYVERPAFRQEDLTLSWIESLHLIDGLWRVAEDIVLDQIEQSVVQLLSQIERVVEKLLPVKIKLEPDRDIVTQRFVSLAPLTVRLNGRAHLLLRFLTANRTSGLLTLEVKGLKLDHKRLHWPASLKAEYQRTFPVLNQFAVSDPRIEIRFKTDDPELALGCKITPPLPVPLSALGKLAIADAFGLAALRKMGEPIRFDNPWLHLLYLDLEGSGRLGAPELRFAGRLSLLNCVDAAQASLTLALPTSDDGGRDLRLSGHLEAGTPENLAGLPLRLEGHLEASGSGLSTHGIINFLTLAPAQAGLRIGPGSLARAKADGVPPPEIAALAHATILGASLDLRGWSNIPLHEPWDYEFSGEATHTVDFLISSRTIGIAVTVTPAGTQVRFIWRVNDKDMEKLVSAPSLDRFDWDRVIQEIKKADEQAHRDSPEELKEHESYLRDPPERSPESKPKDPPPADAADSPTPQPAEAIQQHGWPTRMGTLVALDDPMTDRPKRIALKYFRDKESVQRALKGEGIVNLIDALVIVCQACCV